MLSDASRLSSAHRWKVLQFVHTCYRVLEWASEPGKEGNRARIGSLYGHHDRGKTIEEDVDGGSSEGGKELVTEEETGEE